MLGIPGLTDLHPIGQGGYAIVYRALETDLQRTVAVKVLQASLTDHAKLRFDRERRAMGALSDHPHIVTVYRGGHTAAQQPYLVMEYLGGGSLAQQLLEQGPLRWQRVVEIGVHVSGALETAHRAGVLHRDIKPGNILMSSLGLAKLADFGIARLQGSPNTRTGLFSATLTHAPPEVMSGSRPDALADLYSLGSTLYELLSGSPAFVRPSDESMAAIVARIATEHPKRLDERRVPRPVMDVILEAMAKDPATRPQSAVRFGDRLRSVQRQLGLVATPLLVESIDIGDDSSDTGQRITVRVGGPPPAPPGSSSRTDRRETPSPSTSSSASPSGVDDVTSMQSVQAGSQPGSSSRPRSSVDEPTQSLLEAGGEPTAHGPVPVGVPADTADQVGPAQAPPPGGRPSQETGAGGNGSAGRSASGGPAPTQLGPPNELAHGFQPSTPGRSRRWLWLVILLVVALVGGGVYLGLRNDLIGGDSENGGGTSEAAGTIDDPDVPPGNEGTIGPGTGTTDDPDDPSTDDPDGTTDPSNAGTEDYTYATVVDDTGAYSVELPEEWQFSDSPWVPVQGGSTLWGGLTQRVTGVFAEPGAYVWVDPAEFDPLKDHGTDVLSRLESHVEKSCTEDGPEEAWTRDGFSGLVQRYTNCVGDPEIGAIHYSFTDADNQVLVTIVVHTFDERDVEAAKRMAETLTVDLG